MCSKKHKLDPTEVRAQRSEPAIGQSPEVRTRQRSEPRVIFCVQGNTCYYFFLRRTCFWKLSCCGKIIFVFEETHIMRKCFGIWRSTCYFVFIEAHVSIWEIWIMVFVFEKHIFLLSFKTYKFNTYLRIWELYIFWNFGILFLESIYCLLLRFP